MRILMHRSSAYLRVGEGWVDGPYSAYFRVRGVLSPLPIIELGKNMMVDFGAGIVVGESPPLALSEVGGGGMGNSCLLRKNQG